MSYQNQTVKTYLPLEKNQVIAVMSLINPSIIFDIKFPINTGLVNQMFEDMHILPMMISPYLPPVSC